MVDNKAEQKIKGILVHFFREGTQGDYLDALNNAIDEIKSLSEAPKKEQEETCKHDAEELIVSTIYKGIGQTKNPRTGKYVKIDRDKGKIISTNKTPYKNVPIIRKKEQEEKVIELRSNEVENMKWLLLKGMEITNSDKKHSLFGKLYDSL